MEECVRILLEEAKTAKDIKPVKRKKRAKK